MVGGMLSVAILCRDSGGLSTLETKCLQEKREMMLLA
jgi:hypothetical protein